MDSKLVDKILDSTSPELMTILNEVFSFDAMLCKEIIRLRDSGVKIELNDNAIAIVEETIRLSNKKAK